MGRLLGAKWEKSTMAGTAACRGDGNTVGDFEVGAVNNNKGVGSQVRGDKELAGWVEEDLVGI